MLTKHGINIERAANILRRKYRADFDICPRVGGIDLFEVGAGNRIYFAARDWVARHPAPEIVNLARKLILIAFAEEVDLRRDDFMVALVHFLRANVGKKPDITDADFNLTADLP